MDDVYSGEHQKMDALITRGSLLRNLGTTITVVVDCSFQASLTSLDADLDYFMTKCLTRVGDKATKDEVHEYKLESQEVETMKALIEIRRIQQRHFDGQACRHKCQPVMYSINNAKRVKQQGTVLISSTLRHQVLADQAIGEILLKSYTRELGGRLSRALNTSARNERLAHEWARAERKRVAAESAAAARYKLLQSKKTFSWTTDEEAERNMPLEDTRQPGWTTSDDEEYDYAVDYKKRVQAAEQHRLDIMKVLNTAAGGRKTFGTGYVKGIAAVACTERVIQGTTDFRSMLSEITDRKQLGSGSAEHELNAGAEILSVSDADRNVAQPSAYDYWRRFARRYTRLTQESGKQSGITSPVGHPTAWQGVAGRNRNDVSITCQNRQISAHTPRGDMTVRYAESDEAGSNISYIGNGRERLNEHTMFAILALSLLVKDKRLEVHDERTSVVKLAYNVSQEPAVTYMLTTSAGALMDFLSEQGGILRIAAARSSSFY